MYMYTSVLARDQDVCRVPLHYIYSASYKNWLGRQTEHFQNVGRGQRYTHCVNFSKSREGGKSNPDVHRIAGIFSGGG